MEINLNLIKFKQIKWRPVAWHFFIYFLMLFFAMLCIAIKEHNSLIKLKLDTAPEHGPLFDAIKETLTCPIILHLIFGSIYLLIYGIIASILSRTLTVKYKLFIAYMSGVIALCIISTEMQSNKLVKGLLNYTIFNHGGFEVIAQGSWISDTKLADNVKTVKIIADKATGKALVIEASVTDGYLMISTDNYKVNSWTENEISFEDNSDSVLCNYKLHMDLVNEEVTLTRYAKKDVPDEYSGYPRPDQKTIFMHLGNGHEVLK